MFTRKSAILLLIGSLFSLPLTVAAQGKGVTSTAAGKGGVVSVESLVSRYATLAGSEANVKSLVNGLRSGAPTLIILSGLPLTPQQCTPMPGKPCAGQQALRSASTTTATPFKVEFTSPIGNTGYGNVDIALALAAADIGRQLPAPYDASPTPEQLKAALLGGTVLTAPGAKSSVTFLGVLKLRNDGNGWGEVAKALEFDLK